VPTRTVTDSSFETDVLQSDTPVVVDFWAEWCGPCHQIAPALEEIADELDGRVIVAKVNIDEHPEWAGRYNVRSIPTMMLFRNGEIAATHMGSAPKSTLKGWVESNLA
jgi:thioredoxin 1